jgi:hypothetical protein
MITRGPEGELTGRRAQRMLAEKTAQRMLAEKTMSAPGCEPLRPGFHLDGGPLGGPGQASPVVMGGDWGHALSEHRSR